MSYYGDRDRDRGSSRRPSRRLYVGKFDPILKKKGKKRSLDYNINYNRLKVKKKIKRKKKPAFIYLYIYCDLMVIIGNLNRYVRERDVDRLFGKLGRINDLALMVNIKEIILIIKICIHYFFHR